VNYKIPLILEPQPEDGYTVTSPLLPSLPRRALSLVDEWRQLHTDELLANWQRAQSRQPLAYIDPLE
jgi:hypothetical protein